MKKPTGPFITDEQWALLDRELWCIVRLADNTEAKVYYVDGFAFRNHVDVGLIGGGHGFCYPYLHRDEVVIERMLDAHASVKADFLCRFNLFRRGTALAAEEGPEGHSGAGQQDDLYDAQAAGAHRQGEADGRPVAPPFWKIDPVHKRLAR